MAKNNNLTDFLTDVANTIRAKKGTSAPLDPQDFSDEIATISTSKPEGPANVTPTTSAQTIYPSEGEAFNVVNVSAVTSAIDSNIQASNIKSGVTILGVSGTLQSAVLQSLIDTIDRSTPKTFYPDPGYDGFSVATIGVNLSSRSVTPTSALQTITPGSGYAGFGQVTVLGVTSAIDNNIQASNIKKDVTILGVTGTVEEGGGEDVYAGIINKTLKSYVDKQGLIYSSPLYFSNIKTLSYVELPACSYISNNAFLSCNSSSFAVSIPMVTYIGSSAFSDTGLSSIYLPMTAIIGEAAFLSCKNLSYFEAPAVSAIEEGTFSKCYNLTTVSIPNVYRIGNKAFSNCSVLATLSTFATSIDSDIGLGFNSTFKSLYLFTTSINDISANTFSRLDLNAIYVPTQYVESLKLQNGWSSFASKITALDTNYDNENIYTYEFMNSTIATIPRTSVINIGNGAFRNCANLTNVSLPNCKHIQMQAFECPNINNISLPNCEYILDFNFNSLSMLANLNLSSVKYIGNNCFSDCPNLGTVELPTCQFIGANAFANCSVLNDISLPQCRIIGSSAFKNTRIITANLPNCIMILSSAFSSCSRLTSITLSKCRFIATTAFTSCTSVFEIDLRKQDVVPYAPGVSYKFQNPNLTIYVPKSLYSDFRVDSYWSYLRNNMISV